VPRRFVVVHLDLFLNPSGIPAKCIQVAKDIIITVAPGIFHLNILRDLDFFYD